MYAYAQHTTWQGVLHLPQFHMGVVLRIYTVLSDVRWGGEVCVCVCVYVCVHACVFECTCVSEWQLVSDCNVQSTDLNARCKWAF